MAALDDFPYLLHVPAMTRALADMLAQGRKDSGRFVKLPFVALRHGHPWTTALPDGVGTLHHVSPTILGLIVGIDKMLDYGSSLKRMWAMNGNRWAWGGEGRAPFPILERDGANRSIELLPVLLVPSRLGFPAVINMSVALRPGLVLNGNEPIAVATRIAARHQPIVVAAGNWGQAEHLDTLSPIARLPWCISVGATSDPAGRTLWKNSSIGSPDIEPSEVRAPAPTLVAHGENMFVPGELGTSFAAPRVSRAIIDLTAFLLQVKAAQLRDDGQLGSCPLLLRQWIDSGFKDLSTAPQQALPMLPLMGVDTAACRETVAILRSLGIDDLDPTPAAVTRMLLACVRPMPTYSRYAVGAGFLNDDATLDYLAGLTGLDYAAAMHPNLTVPAGASAALARLRLAQHDELSLLLDLARSSSLSGAFDFRYADHHMSTPSVAHMAGDESVTVEPDPSFWPPASD